MGYPVNPGNANSKPGGNPWWIRTRRVRLRTIAIHMPSQCSNSFRYPITCSDVMAEQHPELVVTFLKAMIKVGRWANEHKHAAAVILDRQTYYRDAEDTYLGIKHIDMVPSLSPKNLAQIEIGKDFMLQHGYIKRDFDVQKWAAPEFLEQAAQGLIEERWKVATTEKLPAASELQATTRRLG